jgi:hypothetical protein
LNIDLNFAYNPEARWCALSLVKFVDDAVAVAEMLVADISWTSFRNRMLLKNLRRASWNLRGPPGILAVTFWLV